MNGLRLSSTDLRVDVRELARYGVLNLRPKMIGLTHSRTHDTLSYQLLERGFGLVARAFVRPGSRRVCLAAPGVEVQMPYPNEGGRYSRGDGDGFIRHLHRRLYECKRRCSLGNGKIYAHCLVVLAPLLFQCLLDVVGQGRGAAIRL